MQVKTVFHLRYLNHVRNTYEEESLIGAMGVLCNDMAKTIKKFGESFFAAMHARRH